MVVITVEGLMKIFSPNIVALDSIDLNIRDGEFIVVLGPNAAVRRPS